MPKFLRHFQPLMVFIGKIINHPGFEFGFKAQIDVPKLLWWVGFWAMIIVILLTLVR